MKLLKRAAALLLVITILFPSADIPLEVSALSIEDAIQCGLAIANDDSHGYSQANRWGPDYDCSSFVLTCLQQAGFGTGQAYTTHSMKAELTRLGFKWYPWDTLNGVPDLKRGDILLDEDYHTEFYIGAGMDLGAFNDTSHPETGDQTGHEICTLPYFSYNWDGVLRYTNDIPNVKPSDLSISTYSEYCAVGQTVHFSIFSINAAEQYITFSKNGKKAFEVNVTDKYEFDYEFTEAGSYSYVLRAKNHLGETKTEAKKIRVYKSAPTNLKLSASKTTVPVNESVTFKFSSSDSTSQTLYIDDGSWWGSSEDVTGKKEYTKKFDKAGIYYFALYASNPIGSQRSDSIRVDVYDSKPYNMGVYTDKSIYAKGEKAALSFGSTFAEKLTLGVSVNGKLQENIDVTGKSEYSLKLDKGGDYECILTGKNSFGETASYPCTFKVYDSAPTDVKILTSNGPYPQKYSVDLSFESKNAVYAKLSVTDESGTVCLDTELAANDSYWYNFPHSGQFTIKVTAVNPCGEKSAEKTLTIYDSVPTNVTVSADKEIYPLGSEIKFSLSAEKASYTTLMISDSDNYYYNSYSIDNKNKFTLKADEAGTFTYYIVSTNDYGETASEKKTYTVFNCEPYDLSAATDKKSYQVNEDVEFTTGGKYAFERILNISVNGEELTPIDIGSDSVYTTSFDVPGDYIYSLTARNVYGETTSEEGQFTVYYGRPEKLHISVDKDEYALGEKAVFTFSSAYEESRCLNIYHYSQLIEQIDVTNMEQYSYMPAESGPYEYSLTAVNPKGTITTKSAEFNVKRGYTVSYDANGGTNAPESQTKKYGNSITLSYETPEREGCFFEGWSSGYNTPVQYYSGSTYSADKDIVLYAVWRLEDDNAYNYYQLKEWKWNDDGTVQAVFADQNESTVSFDADVTSYVAYEPDCTNEGRRMYTASVYYGGEKYTDSTEEMLPALGHDYRLVRWTWTGTTAQPHFVCNTDGSSEVIPESAVTRETVPEDYQVVYTAVVEFEGKTYTTKRTVDGYAIGDVNNDRSVTSDDALETLRVSAGLGSADTKDVVCDVDGDGGVTSGDALEILRYSIGLYGNNKIGEIVDMIN